VKLCAGLVIVMMLPWPTFLVIFASLSVTRELLTPAQVGRA
jgi:hypothetical protein